MTHYKIICPVCKKKVTGIVPRGGDGTALRPIRHVSALDGYTNPCEGCFMEVDLSEIVETTIIVTKISF